MAEATINDVQQVLTYILIKLLPFIFAWFGSLLKTTATQKRLSRVAPTVKPTLSPALLFSRKTSQEETLHGIIFAGKVRTGMHRTNLTFNCGAPIPPSVGYLCLQSWLSNQAVSQNLPSKITMSSHAPTNRI
jgi:hypothetical protein